MTIKWHVSVCLYVALWPLHFTIGSPSCQSKPPLSAVTVEYVQVLLHTSQSGAWQLMKGAGHGETKKHLFSVCCSEDVCWVPVGHLEDAEFPSTSFFCLTYSLASRSLLCSRGITYALEN